MDISLFDKHVLRQETCSYKWDRTEQIFGAKDLLPMWVADMDFKAPPPVIHAIQERVKHGVFGYTYIPETTYNAIKDWTNKRYNWQINSRLISFSESVVPAISTVIRTFTKQGDKIMIQTPVYAPFYEMIEKNNRIIIKNELKINDNQYVIDFEHFESCLKQGVKLFILCNPHNPGGTVWLKEDLNKMNELCEKYNCLILSDDIHADLIFKPYEYVPIATLNNRKNKNIITCISPSKTFNLAGLNAAVVLFENKKLKDQFDYTQRKQGFFSLGTFGIISIEAAYSHGEKWLELLLNYLKNNINITTNFINKNIPEINVFKPQGTYLLWLDCRNLKLTNDEIMNLLINKGKLALESGTKYGEGGEGFVRMNIGCPQELLFDGLERLKFAFS